MYPIFRKLPKARQDSKGFRETVPSISIYIYIYIVFACLSVHLYPINVKTAEPIGPTFCVEPHITPGKVYECSEFQTVVFNKIYFFLNPEKIF